MKNPPMKDYAAIALRHAPALMQKVSDLNPRGDLISRVDITGDLSDIVNNWERVSDPDVELEAAGYYSVVETKTHYFLLYAFYHGQDWHDGDTLFDRIRREFDEHLHDMEGALALVKKRDDETSERIDALITISHYRFYRYAGWTGDGEGGGPPARRPELITGCDGTVDGPIRTVRDGDATRFSLYAQSKGHGIRGDTGGWGAGRKVIGYFPTSGAGDRPGLSEDAFGEVEGGLLYVKARYRLIDFHEPGGLWERRDDPDVFMRNATGRAAFTELDESGARTAGRANPPWGWDDPRDFHRCGEIAVDPAATIYGYFDGLGEYSLEYVRNPYKGIG